MQAWNNARGRGAATTVCIVGIVSSVTLLVYVRHYRNRQRSQEAKKKRDRRLGANAYNDSSLLLESMPPHVQRELMKERRHQKKLPYLVRKSPMYDNIHMRDPNGILLSSISHKKACWYVRKGLAEWSDEDKTAIQLNFTPKACSTSYKEVNDKKNICVGCGSDKQHIRHYIVPYAYRTLLPKQYKSHLSHDIVILCPECHLRCDQESQMRMKEMEERRPDECQHANHVDSHLHHVRSAALALLRWKHKIPPEKLQEYDKVVRKHLNLSHQVEELSSEQLQEAIDVEYRRPNPKYVRGAVWVVDSLREDPVLIEHFIREWRQHFLDIVHPRFLPQGWSVDSPITNNSM